MSDRFRIALHTFLLYGATFALGVATAYRHAVMPSTGSVAALEPTLANFLIFIVVFAVFTTVMVKFARVAAVTLKLFLALALMAGAQFVLVAWLPWSYSIIGAVLLLVFMRLVPLVIVHDVAVGVGIAGISALMGLSITPLTAAVLLAALSFYDIISVYRTRHMVALAGRMMTSGAVFGFLIPARVGGFLMSTDEALEARQVMMLGSGDIGLPLVLGASAVSTSVGASVTVGAFSLAGLLLMDWMFMHQKESAPMAALPPIAMSAVLGYVLATLLGI